MTITTTSANPTGEEFPLPVEADYQAENDCLYALVCPSVRLRPKEVPLQYGKNKK